LGRAGAAQPGTKLSWRFDARSAPIRHPLPAAIAIGYEKPQASRA
jgi:hypothetical protein